MFKLFMPWATICSASQILDWPLIYDHKGDPYTITLTHHVPGKRGLTHWGILETFSTVISTTLVSFSGGSTKLPSLGIRNWVGPKPRIYPHLLKRSKVHKAGPKLTSRQLWQVHRGLPPFKSGLWVDLEGYYYYFRTNPNQICKIMDLRGCPKV